MNDKTKYSENCFSNSYKTERKERERGWEWRPTCNDHVINEVNHVTTQTS